MCGIVGYTGERGTVDVLLEGLSRLEYRGYDSAGVSVIDGGRIALRKKGGKLAVLRESLEDAPLPASATGIGHTRWATHGGPTDENAHPHVGDDGRLSLIHNGIIENFAELRAELEAAGEAFASETDTEAAAKLLGRAYRETGDLTTAMRQVVGRLHGQFTLLAMHAEQPGVVVGASHNSPLLVGYGDGEHFLGSDVSAFVKFTPNAAALDNDQIVAITKDSASVTDFDGNAVEPKRFEVSWDASAADKGGWNSFMAKEISEGPEAVENTMRGRLADSRVELDLGALDDEVLRSIDRIVIVACGTANYSGLVGKYAIETWARVPVEVDLAHEFRYRDPVLDERTLVISISQSGETMDTKMAVQHAKAQGARTLSICNTQGATIPRESEAVLYTHAGPEVAVASTKAFLAQVIGQLLFGLHLARVRGTMADEAIAEVVAEMRELPAELRQVLAEQEAVHELAHWMADSRSVLFLGRHVGYPVALEGALKLKEISYIHAEGFAGGELKHGPIALIEPGQVVFVVVPSPRNEPLLHSKIVSNIQEIRARGARVIAVAEAGDAAVLPYADVVLRVPLTLPMLEPVLQVVPLHIFALELATAKGLDVDQPRNLAKSVTVE
ncbi:glutamine--fructose-6-phosphate transaminase (isomerizing) [Agrococcus sp. Marseille-Q4369]|uniref:glutamine--fructose-6-phosphate transaminase (isomerizing) n=1 Tax=Agrococcus sp. Marseille-Q4369 TaxID=2810513 RepID=UPI001B8D0229|nr:glutamine--fructose-6-phosphate transaminase (isomerizing) [Agrococcus sp. Marseille-Q4369]QUW19982.1 glutamine--fructose-6-phosphate transaminase (isomerizing) [Agrococcus sp. Marseille-Q4369]